MTITELFRLTFFCGLLVVATVEACYYASRELPPVWEMMP